MYTKTILIALVAVVASGCAENRSSLFIKQVLVAQEGCSADSSDTSVFRTRGVLDVAFSRNYAMPVLVANQMTARASATDLVTETNGVQIVGANVRIWVGGVAEGTPWGFYQPTSGYVEPEGESSTWVVAIPEAYLESYGVSDTSCGAGLPPLVTVGVQILGTTTGGTEVDTPEFFFSVDLTCGGLVTCPQDSADELGSLCMSTDSPSVVPACVGQDELIDCRLCSDPAACLELCLSN
jgi:hypothetical protein